MVPIAITTIVCITILLVVLIVGMHEDDDFRKDILDYLKS